MTNFHYLKGAWEIEYKTSHLFCLPNRFRFNITVQTIWLVSSLIKVSALGQFSTHRPKFSMVLQTIFSVPKLHFHCTNIFVISIRWWQLLNSKPHSLNVKRCSLATWLVLYLSPSLLAGTRLLMTEWCKKIKWPQFFAEAEKVNVLTMFFFCYG